MQKAGIRKVRQDISGLLELVREGREILITDRGKPVARLVPTKRSSTLAYPGRSAFRRSMPVLSPSLSQSIVEDREDRL
jgi:prevent-host-death family protein